MGDLAAWLREQVTQDRRAIEAYVKAGPADSFENRHRPVLDRIHDADWPTDAWLEAAARCESHERVLARHRNPQSGDVGGRWMYPQSCHGCGETGDPPIEVVMDLNDCPELRDMGVAFRHRDGYREEWRV